MSAARPPHDRTASRPAVELLERGHSPSPQAADPSAGDGRAGGLGRLVDPQRLFEGTGWTAFRLAVDVCLLALSFLAARIGASHAGLEGESPLLVWMFPPAVLALFALRGLYQSGTQVRILAGLGRLVGATSLAAVSLIAISAFLEPGSDTPAVIAREWLFATLYLLGGRFVLATGQRGARMSGLVGKPTLIVGAGQIGAQVERRLSAQPELGLRPIGYLDDHPPSDDLVPSRKLPVLGAPRDLRAVARDTGAQHVVLAFTRSPDRVLLSLARECEGLRLEVSLVPRLFDRVNVRVALEHIGGLPLFGLRSIDPKGWQFGLKHFLDRVSAALLLVLLSPLLAGIAVGVKIGSPGPILFRQRRIGRDGRDFEMLKFRSMKLAEQGDGLGPASHPAEDTAPGGVEGADRRTPLGTFIRRMSLDELPQLVNVLKGEMSIVGPRPERPEFVEVFGQSVRRYDDRHRVKSGITGWAQVHGLRGKTSLLDRVEWDNYYIANWSLALDLRILLMTFSALARRVE